MAWAFWQHPVSSPRSSNRTCGFPASGSPTGFTARHTTDGLSTRVSCDNTQAVMSLRLAAQLSPKRPDLIGADRHCASHRSSASSKARQKSGSFAPPALPGINARMTLSDSRQNRHRSATLRPLPSPITGLPRLPASPFRRAVPTTPADRAGAHVDCFPAHAAFPKWQEGRHPHCHFRGLLRLHSRYGPLDRSTAQGGLCHEASRRPVTRPPRSLATRSTDNSLGGIFLHWCSAPSGRTDRLWL